MTGSADAVAAYRWGTLILAGAAWAHCFRDARIEEFGWQFRHLDIWALSASAAAAVLMVRLSMGWSRSRHEAYVGTVAVLNAVVLAIHLGPLLSGSAAAASAPMWKLAYLHLIAPLLQIADAVLILGAFRCVGGALGGTAIAALSYVAWLELAVRPLNPDPDGTGGLPYAALDAMDPSDRLALYAAATLGALAFVPALRAIQRALRPSPEAPGVAAAE